MDTNKIIKGSANAKENLCHKSSTTVTVMDHVRSPIKQKQQVLSVGG